MAEYKYENGKYYRQSTKGDWFEVLRDKDGYLTWTLPDGLEVYDNTFKVPLAMRTSDSPFGTVYTIGTGANGNIRHYYSFMDAANAYTKATDRGAFSDPSENILNDLAFDIATGKGAAKAMMTGTKALTKATPKVAKTAWNTGKKLITKQGRKEVAKKAAARTAETVIRETPRVTAGYFAGKGIDELSKNTTGKSFEENVANGLTNHWGFKVSPIFGEIFNPGYVFGYKWMDRGIRRSAFNNITPFSYTDRAGTLVLPTTKSLEAKAVIKDLPKLLLSFRPIKTPVWRKNLENLSRYIPNENNLFGLPISDVNAINNREEAMRLVFGLPSKYPLYQRNNGTVSYNLETIINLLPPNFSLVKSGYNISPSGEASVRYTYRPFKDKIGYGDNLGFNGGYINYQNKDGVSYIF